MQWHARADLGWRWPKSQRQHADRAQDRRQGKPKACGACHCTANPPPGQRGERRTGRRNETERKKKGQTRAETGPSGGRPPLEPPTPRRCPLVTWPGGACFGRGGNYLGGSPALAKKTTPPTAGAHSSTEAGRVFPLTGTGGRIQPTAGISEGLQTGSGFL